MTTLKDLAALVGGKPFGDISLEINGVSEIQNGIRGTITFLANPKYKKFLESFKASAVIVDNKDMAAGKNGIEIKNPQLAFAKILGHFNPGDPTPFSIHPKSDIHQNSNLGSNIAVGPFSVIEEGVSIGPNVFIGPNVTIGKNTRIGAGSRIEAGVTIYHDCEIGNNVLLHSGTVIGSDGFGFVTDNDTHFKIPQTGKVIVEDNVEIGANCTIDRATIGETRIGFGSKFDNQVHIAHNVVVGKGCLLTGQVAIAGSATIGNFCIFAGQSGVAPHLTIGDRAIIAAKTGVTKSLEGGKVYAGMPAREIREQNKKDAIFSRMEKLLDRVKVIEEKIKESLNEQ